MDIGIYFLEHCRTEHRKERIVYAILPPQLSNISDGMYIYALTIVSC
jgi:hypothetical protein